MRCRNLVWLALSLLPVGLEAQSVGDVRWVGTGDAFAATYRRANGTNIAVYAGDAYQAQFRSNSTFPYLPPHGTGTAFGPTVDIYCIDFLHTARTSTYPAYFTHLGTQPLTRTRSNDIGKYMQVAWLAEQMETVLFPLTQQEMNTRAAIHGAMWQIMAGNPVAVQTSGYAMASTGIDLWVGRALSNYSQVNGNDWTVVTDACVTNSGTAGAGSAAADNCGQEFLTRTVTPEPETVVLLATGVILLLGLAGALPTKPV